MQQLFLQFILKRRNARIIKVGAQLLQKTYTRSTEETDA